jgi:hypothetical protein
MIFLSLKILNFATDQSNIESAENHVPTRGNVFDFIDIHEEIPAPAKILLAKPALLSSPRPSLWIITGLAHATVS